MWIGGTREQCVEPYYMPNNHGWPDLTQFFDSPIDFIKCNCYKGDNLLEYIFSTGSMMPLLINNHEFYGNCWFNGFNFDTIVRNVVYKLVLVSKNTISWNLIGSMFLWWSTIVDIDWCCCYDALVDMILVAIKLCTWPDAFSNCYYNCVYLWIFTCPFFQLCSMLDTIATM